MINEAVEENFKTYFTNNLGNSSYNILRFFSIEDFISPSILVGVGKCSEVSYDTNVFLCEMVIRIETQIDEVESTVSTHNDISNSVYTLMQGTSAEDYINTLNNGMLYNHFLESLDFDREGRNLITNLSYKLNIGA